MLDFNEEETVSRLDLFYVDTLSHCDSWVHVLFRTDQLARRIQEENLLGLFLRYIKDHDPVLDGDL